MVRDFHSKLVYHYHLRGFVKKFPLWLILRSPFPFLNTWMFKTFGLYKIGKHALIYESWIGLEFICIEDNTIIGIGNVLSSHLVDEMHRLTIKRIKVMENSQLGHKVLVAPSVEIGENSVIGCHSILPKLKKINPNSIIDPGYYHPIKTGGWKKGEDKSTKKDDETGTKS